MEGIELIVGIVLIAGVCVLYGRRRRVQRLPLAFEGVRCPLHHEQADVTVRIDPAARDNRQYVDVVGCSLLSDAAVALPEQRAYLPDSPPCDVVLEPARSHPVYVTGVSCSQPCRSVLNAAAPPVAPQPLTCASGASDAIDLMRQADGRSSDARLLWYSSSV